jgi:hypothetical protein
MCVTSQPQYELGQKQGKTPVILRLPSGGTGRYARVREDFLTLPQPGEWSDLYCEPSRFAWLDTVWDCKYHLVWATKYRYPILGGGSEGEKRHQTRIGASIR